MSEDAAVARTPLPAPTLARPCRLPDDTIPQGGGHCATCNEHVHDLSYGSRQEALRLLARPDVRCVRFVERLDGTLVHNLGRIAVMSAALSGCICRLGGFIRRDLDVMEEMIPREQPGKLVLRVQNHDGAGVAGIVVEAEGTQAMTDADGRAMLTLPPQVGFARATLSSGMTGKQIQTIHLSVGTGEEIRLMLSGSAVQVIPSF